MSKLPVNIIVLWAKQKKKACTIFFLKKKLCKQTHIHYSFFIYLQGITSIDTFTEINSLNCCINQQINNGNILMGDISHTRIGISIYFFLKQ